MYKRYAKQFEAPKTPRTKILRKKVVCYDAYKLIVSIN